MRPWILFLSAAILAGQPASAQDAAMPAPAAPAEVVPAEVMPAVNPQVVPDATVFGPLGGVVGRIDGIVDGIATIDTGLHKAPLPVGVFGFGEAGPTITVTREQLHGIIEQQLAEAAARRDAAIVPGASVATVDGLPLGTVEQAVGDQVVVERTGANARLILPRALLFAEGARLKTRFTAEQIDASTGTSLPAPAMQ